MKTDERTYLSQFSIWGAGALDMGNTENIKSTNPSYDPFLYHDHKQRPLPPTSRYLSTKPSTYLL